jgi:transcriptional regulator GlxA family with amidase domain
MPSPNVVENQLRSQKPLSPRLQIVLNFADANLGRKLSTRELARSVMISPYQLCRLFKSEMGISPGQYLQSRRLDVASTLLTTTLMSVKQIYMEVGYTDKSLFVRHFKRARGLTPSEYRARNLDSGSLRILLEPNRSGEKAK